MDKLLTLIGDIQHVKLGGADSFADQLNCKYTVFVLSIFAIIATARVYVSEPISCLPNGHIQEMHIPFIDKACWTTRTFNLPKDVELNNKNRENATQISYYQWVALIFCLQAFLFYLPRPIWRMLNKKSGLAVNIITDAAIECQRHRDDGYDKTLKYMTMRLGQFLSGLSRKRQNAAYRKSCGWGMYYGSYLTIVYLIVKVAYFVNAIGQLFLLNAFLGTDFHLYGFDVLRRMFKGEEWTTSARFPRVTICNVTVETVGTKNTWIVQCALPMNLFYEMMFIFLWFWIVFVLIVTSISLLQWVLVSVFIRFQRSYVKDRLVELNRVAPDLDNGSRQFVQEYLRRDGCFIIRLVAKNAGDRIAGDLVAGLWDQYIENEQVTLPNLDSKSDNAIEMQGRRPAHYRI